MIETEVKNLPRGIHNAAVRHQTASANHNKAVGAIPAFLLQQYEKNCQPGLGPPLAGTGLGQLSQRHTLETLNPFAAGGWFGQYKMMPKS